MSHEKVIFSYYFTFEIFQVLHILIISTRTEKVYGDLQYLLIMYLLVSCDAASKEKQVQSREINVCSSCKGAVSS